MRERSLRRLRSRRDPHRGDTGDAAVDWELVADGRPRRLRRGVDFSEPVPEFAATVRRTAARMGRSVVLARDRLHADGFLWVQFADAEIAIGDPCPCGGRQLTRMSGVLLRCDACGAMLVVGTRPKRKPDLRAAPEPGDSVAEESATTLSSFSRIRLVETGRRDDRVEYVGIGVGDDERHVLLAVEVPLVGGRPVPDPSSPTGEAHRVVVVVPESSWGRADPDEGEGSWDIVVA